MPGDDDRIGVDWGAPPGQRIRWAPTSHLTPLSVAVEGQNDDLVERTFNGLRPDDAAHEQPPQDPGWRPAP